MCVRPIFCASNDADKEKRENQIPKHCFHSPCARTSVTILVLIFLVSISVIIYSIPFRMRGLDRYMHTLLLGFVVNVVLLCSRVDAHSINDFGDDVDDNVYLRGAGCIMCTIKIYVHKSRKKQGTVLTPQYHLPFTIIIIMVSAIMLPILCLVSVDFHRKSFSEMHACGAKSLAQKFYYKWNSRHFWQMPNRLASDADNLFICIFVFVCCRCVPLFHFQNSQRQWPRQGNGTHARRTPWCGQTNVNFAICTLRVL